MRFGTVRRRPPRIDISPLIDVVFQLLLFYAVTTQFVADERLLLQLPEARTAEQTVQPAVEVSEVVVTAQGEILMGGRTVSVAELEDALRRSVASDPDRTLTIRGDRGADYGTVIRVLDVARDIGARRINLAAVRPPGTPPD